MRMLWRRGILRMAGLVGQRVTRAAEPRLDIGAQRESSVVSYRQLATASFAALTMLGWMATGASAAQCGSTGAGFDSWKSQLAGEARARGVSGSAIAALMTTSYSRATIAADRSHGSFALSLDQFLAKRGGPAIVALE